MFKTLPIVLVFLCFQAKGQFTPLPETEQYTQLAEKGDSSIYLVEINDTLSYISFADPNNSTSELIRQSFDLSAADQNTLPDRSYLLMIRGTQTDTIVYYQTFNTYYINILVSQFSFDKSIKNRKQLNISFRGKYFILQEYLNASSDSMYVVVENEKYAANTDRITFRVDVPRPKKKKVEMRIMSANRKVDLTIEPKIKKGNFGPFIDFEILESALHSSTATDYVEKEISLTSIDGKPIQFKFIDMEYFRATSEIRYR